MIDIFGPETPRLLRLITELTDLDAGDVEVVADAWRGTPVEERAAAWAVIQRAATPEERIEIQNAALVARRRALTASQLSGRRDWGFWSAAWDAAGAVAAAAGPSDDWSYQLLVSPMATRLPWLVQRTPVAEIPLQRNAVERGVSDEPAHSPRSGGGR